VAAGKQTCQDLAAYLPLADDHTSDFVIETRDEGRSFFEG
jgi:hypothetical protein